MTTRLEAFCNITTDLQGIEPAIDSFDRKRLVQNSTNKHKKKLPKLIMKPKTLNTKR